jgi:cytochrome c oxidase subunit IV
MSTDTAATEHAAEAHDSHGAAGAHAEHHKPDSYYIKVAVFLAVLTALETSTYYVDFGPLFMPALLGMMVIKFITVILLFMHLKDDHKMFSWLFYAGLGLAIGVYVAALLTFRYFG